jgi:hypothetical protein
VKNIDPALLAHLASRGQISSRVLVWFHAVNRLDGSPAGWGVWTGEDDRTFSIGGGDRTYFGAGAMGDPGSLTFEAGYVVRLHRVALSHRHADVAVALAATDIRLRAVEIHQVHLKPGSHDLVAAPLLRFAGVVETLTRPRLAQGASGMAEVQLASSARALTRPVEITKSDATLQAVHPGDRFRRYNAVSGKVTVAWGERQWTPPVVVTPGTGPTSGPGFGGG